MVRSRRRWPPSWRCCGRGARAGEGVGLLVADRSRGRLSRRIRAFSPAAASSRCRSSSPSRRSAAGLASPATSCARRRPTAHRAPDPRDHRRAKTGYGSRGAGILRSGSLGDGSIFYVAAAGAGRSTSTSIRSAAISGSATPIPRASATCRRATGSATAASPPAPRRSTAPARCRSPATASRGSPSASRGRRRSARSASSCTTTSRDNPLTPRDGANALLSVRGYDSAWGSDVDFTSVKLFGAAFRSRGAWTLGAMADGESVTDAAPFFMQPSIHLRGVPFDRYQGGRALSTEVELRRQFHPRWTGLGFVGYGLTESAELGDLQERRTRSWPAVSASATGSRVSLPRRRHRRGARTGGHDLLHPVGHAWAATWTDRRAAPALEALAHDRVLFSNGNSHIRRETLSRGASSQERDMPEQKFIEIRGAREHNLKSIDVDIPRDRLVVITGLSRLGQVEPRLRHDLCRGAAALRREPVGLCAAVPRHDAEARRRPHHRAVAGDLDRAEDHVEEPALDGRDGHRDLRLPAAAVRAGGDAVLSPATGLPIEAQQVSQMVDITMALPEGTRAYLLAPIVRDRKGEYRKEFQDLLKKGLPAGEGERRVPRPRRAAGARQEVPAQHRRGGRPHRGARGAGDAAGGQPAHRARPRRRHRDPGDGAGRRGGGRGAAADHLLARTSPARCRGFTIPEIEPRLFSFNAPFGACPACDGLGVELFFDPRLIVPDEGLTLMRGAIAPWAKGQSPYYQQTIEALAKHYGFDKTKRWRDLPEQAQQVLLYGSEGEKIRFRYDEGGRVYEISRPFEGVIPNMERRYRETDSAWSREEMERYQNNRPCGICHGFRLKPEALAVKIAGLHVGEVVRMSIREALAWVETVPASADGAAERDRAGDPEGDPRAAGVPGQRRARLPDAGAQRRDAVGRREPADPAGEPDRQRADRRALRARRAVDRAAPARQRPAADHAEEPARRRQHGDRRRARRGGDPRGGPCHRHRAGGGGARRRDHRRRHAGGHRGGAGLDHRAVPDRRAGDPGPGASGARATARS